MVKAAQGFGLLGMRRSFKKRALTAKQCGPLLGFSLFRGDRAQTSLTQFFANFICADVLAVRTQYVSVPQPQMILLRQTFQVFNSVVRFVAVNVVDLAFRVKRLQPTRGYNSMYQTVPSTQGQIAVASDYGLTREKISENFSAPRNRVLMIKKPVFNAVNGYGDHFVPFKVATESSVYQIFS